MERNEQKKSLDATDYFTLCRNVKRRSAKKQSRIKRSKIRIVNADDMRNVINMRNPLGLFMRFDDKVNRWVAVDNSTGDAWTEEFPTRKLAEDFLLRKFEPSDYQETIPNFFQDPNYNIPDECDVSNPPKRVHQDEEA